MKTASITDEQIRALEVEAFAAGDALQGYICRVALGSEYTMARLNDSSCLDHEESRQIEAMTRQEAREICAVAISPRRSAPDDEAEES